MAKKMASARTIQVTSLRGALEAILDAPAGKRTVEVRSLEMHHATALVEMLNFLTSRRHWDVQQLRKLKVFASADAVLLILEDTLLPIVANDPTSVRALDLLERYANRIHTLSLTVGSTFEEEVDILHQELVQRVEEGRAKPVAVPVSELAAGFHSVHARITALRDQMVGIGDSLFHKGDASSDDTGDD